MVPVRHALATSLLFSLSILAAADPGSEPVSCPCSIAESWDNLMSGLDDGTVERHCEIHQLAGHAKVILVMEPPGKEKPWDPGGSYPFLMDQTRNFACFIITTTREGRWSAEREVITADEFWACLEEAEAECDARGVPIVETGVP